MQGLTNEELGYGKDIEIDSHGNAFFAGMPADHWSQPSRKEEFIDPPPPLPYLTELSTENRRYITERIRRAGKYVFHATKMNDPNFDQDAFLQNLVIALMGTGASCSMRVVGDFGKDDV